MRKTFIIACLLALLPLTAGAQNKALLVADVAEQRNSAAAVALIKRGADVNTSQPDGATALHWAAQWNDVSLAKHLLDAGARVDATNDYGVTPLFLAATNASADMMTLLLKAGASANASLPAGETVLMTAVRSGSAAVVRALLSNGAKPDGAQVSKGQTALMWAAAEGNLEVAKALIAAGANVRAKSTAGFTPLMFAAREGDIPMVKLLLETGDDVEVSAKDGSAPLLIATAKGHSALAMFLLERGANPEGNVERAGYTPLMWAVCTFEPTQIAYTGIEAPGEWNTFAGIPDRAGKFALIKELVRRGADVNRKMKGRLPEMAPHNGNGNRPPHAGATPFIIAAQSADVEMMRLLLALGADPKARASDDQTAVMAASEGIVENAVLLTQDKRIEALKLALGLGIDIEAQDNTGRRAMHQAARGGFHDIVTFLLAQGADLNPVSKATKGSGLGAVGLPGQSPLGLVEGTIDAIYLERPETADFLRKLGAKSVGRFDPNADDQNSPEAAAKARAADGDAK